MALNTWQTSADPSRLGLNAANTGLGTNELFLKQFERQVRDFPGYWCRYGEVPHPR